MKNALKYLLLLCLPICSVVVMSSFFVKAVPGEDQPRFPYKQAGLSDYEAAAHILSRFTYGTTPQQIDEVVKQGLENWFNQQLEGNLSDKELDKRLNNFNALNFTNTEVVNIYPKPAQVIKMALADKVITNKDVQNKSYNGALKKYMESKGLRPEKQLLSQFLNQKVLRAAYTHNQLQEVMTSFWFNHFNVSITDKVCAPFIPAYERDIIRPNALGKFSTLLVGTAKSPAMLYYLDNFNSAVSANSKTQPSMPMAEQQMSKADAKKAKVKVKNAQKIQGLNENYARELMELHTLGVDGGYTQQDVTNAAKVLTGWTVYPIGGINKTVANIIKRFDEKKLEKLGFVHEGDFLFVANRHDNTQKTVLGKRFGPNGGYAEGMQLLDMLAHHPSTAKFISRKIAIRFVSDNPPQALIDKMAKTFLATNGDIKQVLITMVNAPEFWSPAALREKTKSPFELAIGSVRSLQAEIKNPFQLYTWVAKMGEKMYFYQAPTGFPDRGQFWINTGSLLNRMNFGLALAEGRIPGVKVNLLALNNGHEPESAQAALATYCKLILPGRNLDATIKRLTPVLNDPELADKVDKATAKVSPPVGDVLAEVDDAVETETTKSSMKEPQTAENEYMLAQVVGVIIGSPEFQRR